MIFLERTGKKLPGTINSVTLCTELQCGNVIKTDKIKDLHLDVNAKESRPRQNPVPVAITSSKEFSSFHNLFVCCCCCFVFFGNS